MKAVFNNLTSGASRKAELEYSVDSATHHKADSMEVSVKSMTLSTQMHVTDMKTQRSKPPWTGVTSIKRNQSHGQNS